MILRKIKHVALRQARKEKIKAKRTMEYRKHGAALVIQRKWKLRLERRRCKYVRMRLRNEKRHAAATRIQSIFRSHVADIYAKSERVRQPRAAVVLQCCIRCWLARRERLALYKLKRERSIVASKTAAEATLIKGARTRKSVVGMRKSIAGSRRSIVRPRKSIVGSRKSVVDTEQSAVVKIQARWKGYRARWKIWRRNTRARELRRREANRTRCRASITIQKRIRGIQGRRRFWLVCQTRSALMIQRTWRGFCMRRCMQDLRARLHAVFIIKKYWKQRYIVPYGMHTLLVC